MAKALKATDIAHECEKWARKQKTILVLEKAKAADADLAATTARHAEEMKPFIAKYDEKIERLDMQADEIGARIRGWLGNRKTTTTVESKSAIASIVHGSTTGIRQPDIKKLLALCKKKGVDFWQFVRVLLGEMDKALGKSEVDKICTVPTAPTQTVTLKLK